MAASDEQPEESRAPVTIAAGSGPTAPSSVARSVADEELRAPRAGAPVAPGDVIAGKYRVEEILGEGGMGVVVAARHLALGERVALKFLLPAYAKHANAAARFAREARAVAKIRGEHVARVMDVGALDDGSPYIVMEHLDGVDLARHLATHGPLSVDQTVTFVLQACEAIAEAHSVGIVHRDLKPANLFLTRRPDGSASVKVLDFGISKFIDGASVGESDLTKTAGVVGSPVYMSPEQLQSAKDVDARTDVWSLGTILFELVSGAQPFIAESVPQTVARIMSLPAPKLREMRADAPALLEQVIDRALTKERSARYASVGELASALRPIAPPAAILSIDRICAILASPAAEVPNARERATAKASDAQRSASASDPRGVTASGMSTIVGVAETGSASVAPSAPAKPAPIAVTAAANPVSVRVVEGAAPRSIRPTMRPRSTGSIALAVIVGVAIGGVVVAKLIRGAPSPSAAAQASSSAVAAIVAPRSIDVAMPSASTPASVAAITSAAPIAAESAMAAPIASASMLPVGRASASARSSSTSTPRPQTSASALGTPSPSPSSTKPHAASEDITIQ